MDLLQITSYCWLILMIYWLYMGMQTKMTIKKEPGPGRYIYLAFLLTAFSLVYSHYFKMAFLHRRFLPKNIYISYLGVLITIAGIFFAIAARHKLGKNWSGTVTIKKDHELIQNGPYAITRHPIYTGMFFGLAGAVIVLGEIRGLIGLALFFIGVHMKIKKEESFMLEIFPAYKNYSQKTKKIIPFVY